MRRDPAAERDRAPARHPVPDRARPRGDPPRLPARRPQRRARARPGPGDLPAAAALCGGLFRRSAGPACRRPRVVADLDRTGAAHDLRGRGRQPRAHRPTVGRRLRARRHRLANRSRRRDRDHAAARRPAAARQHDRGRKPRQRCLGADRIPGRDRRRDRRQLLAVRRQRRLRRRGRWVGLSSGWSSVP